MGGAAARRGPLAIPLAVDRALGQDEACVAFLRWALPRLRLRWQGFRKVRRQVCRRIHERLRALEVADLDAYRGYLEEHPGEWSELGLLCTASISRFCRDRSVFEALAREVLPQLAAACEARHRSPLRCWSVGCASGEEPYSLNILWHLELAAVHPGVRLEVLATDVDASLLARAERGRYRASSLRELPAVWLDAAFQPAEDQLLLRPEFQEAVELRRSDLRTEVPDERFDLILCRNLAFTYFEEDLQREVLARLVGRLLPGGALVIGLHERLPSGTPGVVPWNGLRAVYRHAGEDEGRAGLV